MKSSIDEDAACWVAYELSIRWFFLRRHYRAFLDAIEIFSCEIEKSRDSLL